MKAKPPKITPTAKFEYSVTIEVFGKVFTRRYTAASRVEAMGQALKDAEFSIESTLIQKEA